MKIPTNAYTPGPSSQSATCVPRSGIPTVIEAASKCNRCGLCRKDCAFLKRYGLPGDLAAEYLKDPSTIREIAFSCSLCRLCEVMCPIGLNPAEMFLDLRKDASINGGNVFAGYRNILSYERRGASQRYSWKKLPTGCTAVFFPGCTLPGTRPRKTLLIYDFLLARDRATGIVLHCCSKPSHDLGRQKTFEAAFSTLHHDLLASGVKKVITACPNCNKVFSQYGKGLEVTTIYELLAAEWYVAKGHINAEVTVHDPCVTRDKSSIHDAVRSLIRDHGLTIREMPHAKEKTICCGEGGSVACRETDLPAMWQTKRKQETNGLPILTYCAGCAANLGRFTPTYHLIDLLFEPKKTIDGKVRIWRAPFTYINRLRFKKTLQRQG